MTENELAALRQRAERAAQKGGVVAVEARTLLRLLDEAQPRTVDPESEFFTVEIYINRVWKALYGPFTTAEQAIAQADEFRGQPVRVVKSHKEIVKVYEGK